MKSLKEKVEKLENWLVNVGFWLMLVLIGSELVLAYLLIFKDISWFY